MEGELRCEQDTALADKAAGHATPATGKTNSGEMSNSAGRLISGIAVSVGEVAPVSVEFVDTKGGESDVANLFVGPLVENIAQDSMIIELEGEK